MIAGSDLARKIPPRRVDSDQDIVVLASRRLTLNDDDAGAASAGSARLTQKVEAVHKTLEAQRAAQRKLREIKVEEVPVAKLYIEDDDIEDD